MNTIMLNHAFSIKNPFVLKLIHTLFHYILIFLYLNKNCTGHDYIDFFFSQGAAILLCYIEAL